ncbi:MAG: energy transducer TonB [Deferribacteres bacterium]|nr:energy transducer TonB [candidate division KSB1 bacterium]MCB9509244.1 energy transducer TonB [Deferribacteres bacterium]
MSTDSKILHLRIEQNGKSYHRYVQGNKPFYIGKHAKNDLTLIGEKYPTRHPLFLQKGKRYFLLIPPFAQGEVKANNSKLKFADLIEHELLPKGKGFYSYEIKPGRMGYLFLDSSRIDFLIEQAKSKEMAARPAIGFEGFDPVRVFWKHLKEDAFFKGIVAAMLVLNIGTLYGLRDYIPAPKKKADLDVVTQRLTRFVINNPTPPPEPVQANLSNRTEAPAEDEPEQPEAKQPEPQQAPPPVRKRPNPSNLGVLALLTGSGESNQSNSVINNLLQADLATSVDSNVRSGRLEVGKSGDGDSDTDALLDVLAGGGIDDLIGDLNGVESVELSEKGSVNIETIGEVTGSEEAIGARSEVSLRDVLQKNMGRLTYIYNKYLRQNTKFGGLMRVIVTVEANGSVSNVELKSSNMGNADFEREVMAAIRRFKFDSIASGSLQVEYPLSFYKQ